MERFVVYLKREKEMEIYGLLDLKLKEFSLNVMVAANEAFMLRATRDGVPGSGSLMEKHPEDFALYCLGTFDPDTGMIVPFDVPRLVDSLATILGMERVDASNG